MKAKKKFFIHSNKTEVDSFDTEEEVLDWLGNGENIDVSDILIVEGIEKKIHFKLEDTE